MFPPGFRTRSEGGTGGGKAAARLSQLHAEYAAKIERVVTGICLVEGFKDWSLSFTTSCFAAPWTRAKAHAALEFYLTIPTVQNWAELTPLFDALYEKAEIDSEKWWNQDDAESYSRRYHNDVYKADAVDGEFGLVRLTVTASLPGDTETCKRVIVGYREAVQSESLPATPIYELVCE
jgi:hypothetical protein